MFGMGRGYKLRNRLVLAYLGPVLVLILVFGVVVHFSLRHALEEQLGERLIAVAQAVAGTMGAGRDGERLARLEPHMETIQSNFRQHLNIIRQSTGVERIFVFSPDLECRVDTDLSVEFGRVYPELGMDRVEMEQVLKRGNPASSILFRSSDGRRHKNGYAPIRLDNGEIIGGVAVEGSAGYYAVLDRFKWWLLTLGAVNVGLLIVISVLVAAQINKPVGRLVKSVVAIGKGGGLGEPIQVDQGGCVEISFLGHTLNEMRVNLEAREKELQVMLASIAHEVRNPLGGMELFCGLLREDVAGDEGKTIYVERIQKEIATLKSVVDEFLGYARKVPLVGEMVGVAGLFEDVLHAAALRGKMDGGVWVSGGHTEEFASVSVSVSVEPVDLVLWGDRDKLHRMLLNLVSNSLNAIGQGAVSSSLRLGARVVKKNDGTWPVGMTLKTDVETAILLTVEDDGQGMDAETQANAFMPFFTTREKGTGLGLAIVKRIVEEHLGWVGLVSRQRMGTEVTILLPHSAENIYAPINNNDGGHMVKRPT